MVDIIDVKKKVREILLADTAVKGIVSDRVYVSWLERDYVLPCVTIIDVDEAGEVGMLGGAQDEYHSLVQVDVWCEAGLLKGGTLNRDELAKAVKVALGKKVNFEAMQTAGFVLGASSIQSLDELDVKPPVYRKSMRFPVMYFTDSYG